MMRTNQNDYWMVKLRVRKKYYIIVPDYDYREMSKNIE